MIPDDDDPLDPLGYDTSDPNYLRKMARDALEGRHQEAVQAELAAMERALGLTPRQLSRWHQLRRWLSHRYWRVKFWIEDRR